jgi:three-Cys-motif partner protein
MIPLVVSLRRKEDIVQSCLQPQNDGLPMRESGSWVVEKLDYLKRYIDMFETSMHNKPWRKRHYIDLFAGPGKCFVPETGTVYLGSPLLSLTTLHPFTDYFFVDLDAGNIATLQQRCRASPVYDRIQFRVGDSNLVAYEIVDHILTIDNARIPHRWSSLNLAFLDPDGLELQWETIALLARPYRMDLIIHYPQGGLNRYMGRAFKSKEQTKVDLFFGGTEWREIYKQCQSKEKYFIHRQLMDYYKEKLQVLGYQEVFRDDEVGDEPLIRNAAKRAPLYRLLFASKHPRGHEFWQKVTRRDAYGQVHLL